jgi:uncharacterized protein (DUF488 family)
MSNLAHSSLPMKKLFFTLGYEKSDLEAFIGRLQEHSVTMVVDVRSLPLSRKKGFSKKALTLHLHQAGIDYRHIPALGAPKALRQKRKAGGLWADYVVGYTDLVLRPNRLEVVALADLAATEVISLLCFERNPEECHRSLLAAEMISRSKTHSLKVEHIRY